jgi:ABC-type polysaccharide/polyol phosphate export permease
VTPRAVLGLAAGLAAVLSVAVVGYGLGWRTPGAPTRYVHPLVMLLPMAVSVAVVQALAYDSVWRRLWVSLVVAVAAALILLVVLFVLGCGWFAACTR